MIFSLNLWFSELFIFVKVKPDIKKGASRVLVERFCLLDWFSRSFSHCLFLYITNTLVTLKKQESGTQNSIFHNSMVD